MVTTPRAGVPGRARCHVEHGWLPLVLPAGARSFRIADAALRGSLKAAGAEFVDDAPDVEIGPDPQGDAQLAVVPLRAELPEGGWRTVRAARRAGGHALLRARAARAARGLRRLYPDVSVVWWDIDRPFGTTAAPARLAQRLPPNALVIARKGGAASPTVLEEVLAETRVSAATPFVARVVVAAGADAVVRVAVGPAARQIESQSAALEALRASGPPEELARLVPWVGGQGRSGPAVWSLERRVRGSAAALPLEPAIEWECVDFLTALHALGCPDGGRGSIVRDAEIVAAAVPPLEAVLLGLAGDAERQLAGVPRGFGHGDFWSGNLLVEGGRLAGVVDWDSAGPERLPLLDLLHLRLNSGPVLRPEQWGPALLAQLVPWARAGGDDASRAYLDRIGVQLDPAQLIAMVVAYWLDRVAYQVDLYEEIATSPLWLRRNVVEIAQALGPPSGATLQPASTIADLEEEWSDLALASRNVFGTPEWARVWWRHFGKGQQLRVRSARDAEGRLVAVVPLYEWRRAPVRVLRVVGHGPADRLGPVCAPADTATAARALLDALAAERADLFIGEQFPADENWSALLGARQLAGAGSPVLRFAGAGWEDYLASRSRNFREQIRRRERRLAREHEIAFRLSDDPARLTQDLDILFRLHAAHWDEASSSSAFPQDEAFHREFARSAHERGWLRLWLLEADGRPVAAWYGFRFGGVECYYQAGRDPAWDDRSVGFVLLAHSIRAAIEDGADEYWFLRGSEEYKYRFATGDPRLETFGLARTPRGHAALSAVSSLRRVRPAAAAVVYAAGQLFDVVHP